MKVRTFFILLLLVIGLIFTVIGRIKHVSQTLPEEVISSAKYVELAPLNVLVVQADSTTQEKRVLLCRDTCQLPAIPTGAQGGAYTDGTSWYYYAVTAGHQVKNNQNGTDLIGLYHVPIKGGESKPIIVQNPLVQPRGIYVSPSGKKIIYFLDNIAKPEKKLTELWAYDTDTQAVSVLQENIQQTNILTRLRFNAAGNVLWYVGNSGSGKEPKPELVIVPVEATGKATVFSQLDWQALATTADRGVMDINADASAVALAQSSQNQSDTILIARANGEKKSAQVPGQVVFLQWLKNGDLLYAVQTAGSFSFWRLSEATATKIVSHAGVLRSARSDVDGTYVALAADTLSSRTQLFTLEVESGLIKDQASVPAFGQNVYVVQVNALPVANNPAVAGITSAFADDQIVPLIEKNIVVMAKNQSAKATRLLFTNSPNTLYVDYGLGAQEKGRLLVLVRDVVNPEWSVEAYYKEVNTQWQKYEGSRIKEPTVTRIYEWEDSLKKWILKNSL